MKLPGIPVSCSMATTPEPRLDGQVYRQSAQDAVQIFIYTQDQPNLFATTVAILDRINFDVQMPGLSPHQSPLVWTPMWCWTVLVPWRLQTLESVNKRSLCALVKALSEFWINIRA